MAVTEKAIRMPMTPTDTTPAGVKESGNSCSNCDRAHLWRDATKGGCRRTRRATIATQRAMLVPKRTRVPAEGATGSGSGAARSRIGVPLERESAVVMVPPGLWSYSLSPRLVDPARRAGFARTTGASCHSRTASSLALFGRTLSSTDSTHSCGRYPTRGFEPCVTSQYLEERSCALRSDRPKRRTVALRASVGSANPCVFVRIARTTEGAGARAWFDGLRNHGQRVFTQEPAR